MYKRQGVNGQPVLIRYVSQLGQEAEAITVAANDVLAVIPADDDVRWYARNEDTRTAGHSPSTLPASSGGQGNKGV